MIYTCIQEKIKTSFKPVLHSGFIAEMNMDEGVQTKKKASVRQKWSEDEEKELKELFVTNITKMKCPNTADIKKAMKISKENKGLIHLRKLENIKKKMSNMIIKMRRS